MNEPNPATPASPESAPAEGACAGQPGVPPRVQRWCAQLLDLSRRNRLLNFKEGPHAVRLELKLPARLEDALAEGEAHKVLELPPDATEDFLAAEAEHHRLYVSSAAGAKTYARLLSLFRAARTDLEEGGSNTLFLALGALKWKDGKGDKAPVYRAPILLLPVLLTRLPAKAGFTLKAADDDPVANVTLLEMLKREQRVAPEGVDPLPADEHGVDVDAVLSSFRASVRSLEGWEVLPEVWLGRFSFSKFLMWKDLTTRLDDLAKSPVVAHLVKGGGAFDDGVPAVEPSQVDGISDEAQPLCPLAADSSQLSAVLAAQRGRNFVLHGPPGTGKSQTITNLIASCMAAGRTVLFVAEKRAALEVVQRRLRKIGLAPFCLELHSNKAGKADVLRQFAESLAYAGTTPPEAWDAELAKLRAARKKLDAYVRALHKPHPCGLTPYRAFSYLLAHGADEELAAPVAGLPDAPLGERGLADSVALVEALAETARDVPAELFDPFAFVWATAWTPSFADEMDSTARSVLAAADEFDAAAAPVRDALGFDPGALPDARLTAAARLADLLAAAPVVPAGLLASDWETARGALERWTAFRAAEPAFVPAKLLTLDLASLKRRWTQANAGFFARLFKRGGVRKAIGAALPEGEKLATKNDKVAALLDAIEAAQAAFGELRALRAGDAALEAAVRDAAPDTLAAWSAACDAAWPARDLGGDDNGALLDRIAAELAKPAAHRTPGAAALAAFSRAEANLRRRIAALAAPAKSRPGEFPPAGQSWAGGWRAAAEAVVENGGKLREWTRWRETYIACEKGGLAPIAAAVAAGTLPAADGVAALRKRYCERFVRTVLDADETLRSFFGNGQDALVATFGRLDGEIADLSRRMILARLSLRAIKAKKDPALLSELALLNHEVAKKTRQLPPRTLLQRLPGLLPVLKPCLLMSPLSVAQYLPPESDGFDVVVFDEASQLTVWDAVGVLARGKQAVVVGDPKQLPPTNFFQKADPGAAEDAEPDEDAVEDLDSILDECKAAGVPEQALLWHYRSRHESLIAFSNERYYGGKLFTFPSAAVARKGLGVSRVKVEGGVYDRSRTRTNRKEAEAVVAAVVERLLDPAFSDKTCGVVTFSMAQQALIEDLLDDEQTKHPEIQRFFDSSLPEPFFVKNLENVQGDERDAIFFSIGYAPDEKGFFAMNFGPLNRPGGERRLNVAVTRAKEEVVVFTSIDSTQIDLSRTAALGAAHLREFLAYAERATREAAAAAGPGGSGEGAPVGDFETEVAEFLRLHGYTVDARIGRSGYRVDLAVRNQPDDGGYAIGVECDGAMYRDAASARDRDESRRGVLEGLGWRMARCWCLEWWFDREGAQRKLLAEVDAAVRGLPPPNVESVKGKGKSEAQAPDNFTLSTLNSSTPSPGAAGTAAPGEGAALAAELAAAHAAPDPDERPYEPAPLDATPRPAGNFNLAVGPVYVKDQMLRIANAEGPIAEKLLFARVLEEWGFQSATENRLKVLKKSIPAELPVTTHLKEKVYWPVGADPSAWHYYRVPGASPRSHRAFKEIPMEEIAAAIAAENRAAIAAGGTAAADPYPGAVARLGLPRRVTADMRPVLDAAKRLK